MARDRNQGVGHFLLPEGFAFRDATGYAKRDSRYGCQPVWPGYFADAYNWTDTVTKPATAFGPGDRYQFMTDQDGTCALACAGGELDLNFSGKALFVGAFSCGIYPTCPTIPTDMGNQAAEVTVVARPNVSPFAPANFGGGPGAMLHGASHTKGYHGEIANVVGIGTVVNIVDMFNGVDNRATIASTTISGAYTSSGTERRVRLEATVTGGNTFLEVFIDGVSTLTYNDSPGRYSSGLFWLLCSGNQGVGDGAGYKKYFAEAL